MSMIEEDLRLFLAEWHNDSPYLEVQTSGSTGMPKQLTVRKEQMWQGARLTCEYLGLRQGDKALLCMPLQYIAGKMMVVRSLYAGLDLIVREPSGHPMVDVEGPLRFAAMIPLQVYNTLQMPEERERLGQTDILIIGGGAINAALEAEIRKLPNAVYSTYGMTETLSHIALRKLNGPDASPAYHPFPSVALSLSLDDTLVVDAPLVCDEKLVTNDVAVLHPDGSFVIQGRKDNIINSGGIKIQIESVEALLHPIISVNFAITSVPDPKFGEAVVLLMEKETNLPLTTTVNEGRRSSSTRDDGHRQREMTIIVNEQFGFLPKYQRPRYVLVVDTLPLTGSGKIDRAACRKLAAGIIGTNDTD